MKIVKLDKNNLPDFRKLISIFNEVFENDDQIPDNEYLGKLLANQDFMVFVVKVNNSVVGGLTIYVLHGYYSVNPIAYIYDVGIAPSYQGQGLGKLLIAEVCQYCKEHGFDNAYVEAERDDIDAVTFYRKTRNSNELNAIHFTYTLSDDNFR